MKKIWALCLAIIITFLPLLPACAESSKIDIGVAYPKSTIDEDTYFFQGLEMAVDEVNAAGGISGREVNLVIYDDGNDITEALKIAQSFLDSGIELVIGHWSSNVCYVVEQFYETNNMLMISPAATSTSLFDTKKNYIFRTIPSNDMFAKIIAKSASNSGLKNVAIYYSDDVYGKAFSNRAESELRKVNINVVDRITSMSHANSKKIADRWTAFGVDGVLVAAVMPEAASTIQLIREVQPTLPIFGAENFERKSLKSELKDDLQRIFRATYDIDSLDQSFVSEFRNRYNCDPGVFAISGYQAMKLLSHAADATSSTSAGDIAAYLKSLKDYETLAGTLSYNPDTQEFDGQKLHMSAVH